MKSTTDIKSMLAEMAAESKELRAAAGGPLTDVVSDWLVPQYVESAREQIAAASDAERWKVLRLAANDVAALRRGDHAAARLALDRDKFNEIVRVRRMIEEREQKSHSKGKGISPRTLRLIEEELRLL